LEGSGGPAGEPERTIESDGHRLVRSRARVGGSRAPRESQGARQGVSGVPGGSQGGPSVDIFGMPDPGCDRSMAPRLTYAHAAITS